MKKILVVVLIFLSSFCFAGDILPITFGPLVSMTSNGLKAKPAFVSEVPGSGYNFGGFVRFKLLFLYGQGEVSWGEKSTFITADNNEDITFDLKGTDVSLILGLKLIGIGDLGNLRVFGGYNWSNYSDITYTTDGNTLSADNVNSNNHSFLFGAGMDLFKFSFDVKYLDGLSDITSSNINEVETEVVNVTFSYRFR